MRYVLSIPVNGVWYRYYLLFNKDFQVIHIPDLLYMHIWKKHNHNYGYAAFLYCPVKYIYPRTFSTKKELYFDIQFLLQKELYGAGQ